MFASAVVPRGGADGRLASTLVAAGVTGAEGCMRQDPSNTQPAVAYPASDQWVTPSGGTSLALVRTQSGTKVAWNDTLFRYPPSTGCCGAGGGGISSVWTMPGWQAGPGVINAYSSGAPCGAGRGYCREVPDVSANGRLRGRPEPVRLVSGRPGRGWIPNGGTSAATPALGRFDGLDRGRRGLRRPAVGPAESRPLHDRGRA